MLIANDYAVSSNGDRANRDHTNGDHSNGDRSNGAHAIVSHLVHHSRPELIRPPAIAKGEAIGVVAPSYSPRSGPLERGVKALKRAGYEVILDPDIAQLRRFQRQEDERRASNFMGMWLDPRIKAVIGGTGGYGAVRMLPYLEPEIFRNNPKIFVGYSDITSLHCAFLVKSGLISFHGPMLNSDFIKKDFPEFTLQSFLRTLTQATAPGSICAGYKGRTVSVLRRGTASGPLIGGNISLLCATLGTSYQPSFKNSILFFEDLDEVPFRFDRMLTQLLNAGLLQQVAGIAIGINADCYDPKAKGAREYRQTLEDVFRERLLPLKIPIVSGLPFGHIPMNATLPVGIRATLEANKGDLLITESAVSDPR
jgi:muramoyltetrapeptide carboxypeptidase